MSDSMSMAESGVALGGMRQRARRVKPRLGFLSHAATSVVITPPETVRPHPAPPVGVPRTAKRDSARRIAPRQRLAALGAWARRHGLLRHEAYVAYLASALSIAAYVWYSQRGQTLAYNDAISHMSIARRVFASHTPGLAQLGTVWPPLNHILMLPLVWITPLYRDGFAGTFPSMVAYVCAAVYLYRTTYLLFSSALGGWAAALLLMLNPNVLYMQATPMSELDLLCFAVIAIYYATRWARTLDAPDLVKSALATAAGTLVRYDGWALGAALVMTILFIAWRKRGRLFAESNLLLYATLGFAGCVAWLIYQQVIFGNPLDFLNGPYSAVAQEHHIQTQGSLPTYHNVLLAIHIYAQSVIDNAGLPLCLAALAGLVWWVVRSRRNLSVLPAYAALVPFGFNCLSLVLGITVMNTPEILTGGRADYFNVRYGMMMLPAVALFAGLLAARSRWLLSALIALALIFGFTSTFQALPYVLGEPLLGNKADYELPQQEAQWLASHYHGGEVLISGAPFSAMMYYTGLPEHDFLTDGDGTFFHAALNAPQNTANWVVMDTSGSTFDPVWAALHTRSDWRRYYVLVQTFGTVQIYERESPGAAASASVLAGVTAGVSSAKHMAADSLGFAAGITTSRALAAHLTAQQTTGAAA